MKGYWEITSNSKTRIKPLYSPDEVSLIESWIEDWLRILKDTGKSVNYEEMCQRILDTIPGNFLVIEFENLIIWWKRKFSEKYSKRDRSNAFKDFIKELHTKWLIKNEVHWLTGSFSEKITSIIQKNSTN